MTDFKLLTDLKPKGSQPEAIKKLVEGLRRGEQFQTLLGVTGSGKTFSMGNIIEQIQKPTLVLAHNKTLAAQLFSEFKEFFPDNRVEYFVSYYDYYQPESYIPEKDQYIEKDADVNPKIEQMRLSATASVLDRPDTIVVASVSCIYNVGDPSEYRNLGYELRKKTNVTRDEILDHLIDMQYERNDMDIKPGIFRVKGEIIDLIPGYYDNIIRIELFEDKIEKILEIDKLTGDIKDEFEYIYVYPAKHFVISEEKRKRAIESIKQELQEVLPKLDMFEAHRLKQRTLYDLEMIEETGFCKGIENYSRHMDGRHSGEKPFCFLDYFPKDFLMFIDESHRTIPQIHGMHQGDYSRKKTLIDYGFRLPSAFDNRPLTFDEFKEYMIVFFIPSSTPLYIIFKDIGGFGMVWAYILCNLVGGVGSFFLYRLGIFERIKKIILRKKEPKYNDCFNITCMECNRKFPESYKRCWLNYGDD